MASLHGSWILESIGGYLFIWGETWRTISPAESSQESQTISSHPFGMRQQELLSFLESQNLSLENFIPAEETTQKWQAQVVTLPTQVSQNGEPLFPMLSAKMLAETTEDSSLALHPWKVEGFRLHPIEAANFLQALPLSSVQAHDIDVGGELRFWSQVYRWSLDLLARCKFLPGLAQHEKVTSYWQPLLDSANDQTRFRQFVKLMPDACRAYFASFQAEGQEKAEEHRSRGERGRGDAGTRGRGDTNSRGERGHGDAGRSAEHNTLRVIPSPHGHLTGSREPRTPCPCLRVSPEGTSLPEPQELLLDFLSTILDAQLRTWVETSLPPVKESAVKQWLQALSQEKASFEAEPTTVNRLKTALQTWTLPVQDSMGTELIHKWAKNQFRTCFSLQPPSSGETDWTLQYGLQAIDEETLFVDAETIWQHPVEQMVERGYTIEQPQETLLKGLGTAARLYSPIAASLEEARPHECHLDPILAYEFIKGSAWQLLDSGLGVVMPPGLAPGATEKRLGIKINAEAPQKTTQRLGLQSLLNFKWELAIGEQNLSKEEFERLLAQQSPLVEVNGEWVALQPSDVRAAQAVLESSDEQMSLSVEDAVRLSQGDTKTIEKLPVVDFEASGALRGLITNLTGNKSLEAIQPPKSFQGQLRPYQARGVSWLAFLEGWGLGACLADDMGLGKTIELIAFLLHLKERGEMEAPTLLVCPTSVLGNWQREVQRFAPTLSTLVHHGEKRSKGKAFTKQVKEQDLVITSYALAQRDAKTLQGVSWQGVVLDEAQNIKNPQAKQSQAVRQLESGFRIALTGTPVENRLSEMWSIWDFLNPGYLGTQQFFQRRFAMPIEKYGDRDSLQTLRSLVQPFILRRVKTDKEIIQDLPDKQEMNVYCGLSSEQASLYQKLVDESLNEIEETEGIQRRGKVLTLLMKLKQLCNHPAHYLKEKRLEGGDRSGKLLRLSEMLEEIAAEGERALIFTQFSEWGKLLKPYLEQRLGGEVPFLYGATRKKQREEMVDRFQNDPEGPRAFILSLKAGGTGLNLTRANHVFHVDRWWNPAVENQATDRTFRIGQKRNVQVHKFVSTGTLEERINDLIESKKGLAEQTVDSGEEWLTELDTNQLRSLVLFDRKAVMDEE